MSSRTEQDRLIDGEDALEITRREAIQRVTALLGGIALVGGNSLLAGCASLSRVDPGSFSPAEIAFLDEIAETMLPETSTPGAKAAGVGPFMAHMVNSAYAPADQRIFRDGMRQLDRASRRMHRRAFMSASPEQRLALLEQLDREQKAYMDAREAARREERERARREADAEAAARGQGEAYLPDERQASALGAERGGAAAITADAPAHYFRMMKELALLGYFTSEIGYHQAMRYVETPGRFDPCLPYTPGERAWAPHA